MMDTKMHNFDFQHFLNREIELAIAMGVNVTDPIQFGEWVLQYSKTYRAIYVQTGGWVTTDKLVELCGEPTFVN